MKRLIFVRHVSTDANEKGVLCGKMETEINEKGKKELDILYKMLINTRIDSVHTSNSKRCIETAEYIIKDRNVEIKRTDGLSENSFGDFEGMTFNDIEVKFPDEYKKLCEQGNKYRFPNGESTEDSYKRVSDEIDNIINDDDNENILICAHAGSIRNALAYLINNNCDAHWKYKIENASVGIVEVDYGFAVLTALNKGKEI